MSEPRELSTVEVDAVTTAEACIDASRARPDAEIPPGSRRGMRAVGTPRNLGGPVLSAPYIPVGTRVTKPKTQAGGLPSPGSEERAQRGTAP